MAASGDSKVSNRLVPSRGHKLTVEDVQELQLLFDYICQGLIAADPRGLTDLLLENQEDGVGELPILEEVVDDVEGLLQESV